MDPRALHAKTLRGLTIVELDDKTQELKKELFNLRFQAVAGRVESPAKIKQTRRGIARVKTILREQQKGEAGPRPVVNA